MKDCIEFGLNKAASSQIVGHLSDCDVDFVPPLSERFEIKDYAEKIANKATRLEAWSGDKLVGLLAVYCNDQQQGSAFITSVSVLKEWKGRGIAAGLMQQCIAHVRTTGMRQISLEVARDNLPAIGLYEKSGFVTGITKEPFVVMSLNLE
jgi:ribosomal protein S18 acetylase RimI-like enzyme